MEAFFYFCLMVTEKSWILKEQADEREIDKLSSEINVNPVLSNILLQRGISDFEKAKRFFRPSLDELHDPFLMKGMDIAATRLIEAIEEKQSILVYGDYDVDGTTAVSTLYSFLLHLTDQVHYYIPDRYLEGYGVSRQGIEYAVENKCDLIISLDCGIKAIEQISYAKENQIDFIVCDHHLPGKDLPPALAILDPKQEDCPYPYKELSGCGVGFKLIQAVCHKLDYPEHIAFEYLDLLAVSIAADIVSVTGENRILAYYGLEKINFNPRPGIKALLRSAGVKGKVAISHLVFQLSPRINAAGRIDHAHLAVRLLTAKNEEEADIIASSIGDKNDRRKDFDKKITEQAIAIIRSNQKLVEAKSTVLYQKDWHKGVIGIVASRCIEQYYRPTIILTQSNGKATGSARSVHGFNVHKAIGECSDLIDQFGGHMYAAGLTMPVENISAFQAKFEEVVSKSIEEEMLVPKVEIDSYIRIDQITDKFYHVVSQMDPFGPENMTPVFAACGIELVGDVRVLKGEHLKFQVKDKEGDRTIDVIGFGMHHLKNLLSQNSPFEIAFTIQQNEYLGLYSIQLMLKDIRAI